MEKLRLSEALVGQLYELACTPFTLACWQAKWTTFGWDYDQHVGDKYGLHVQVTGDWSLMIDPLGERVVCASLPWLYWEDYAATDHADPAEYRRQRQAYDDEFAAAARLAGRVLPSPVQAWKDQDEAAHQAVIWAGSCSLLILQQACFDPQFGIEINFWLPGCIQQDFQPHTPLIDWLGAHSQAVHDQQGFPPLRW